ncbi:hypothetical protein [Caenimonas aquaedulcis]|uniref:Aminopeptidase N-like N-terminal domain-containing protein n=1 Tax=Caenimonas aquaedulcis TaxID=2793270 RepID=A0A931MIY3_9BURK|nr:hypothetical protein [Caenimonas aquaedulcis]MBG9390512.1 hypothetical protein [Caenimonas aquaedulcis]
MRNLPGVVTIGPTSKGSVQKIISTAGWGLFLSCVLACGHATAQPRFVFDDTPASLPKSVVPSRTQLTLTLDPAMPTFAGEATIHIRVREPVDAIVLNARELQLQGAAVLKDRRATARELRVAGTSSVRESWALRPVDGKQIQPGEHTLHMRYTGKVNSTGEGLFAVTYRSGENTERMLATQLEAVHARRLLPTFDAPLFRQVFQLDVLAPPGQEVFSNTPRTAQRAEGPMVRHSFAPHAADGELPPRRGRGASRLD